jgi:D-glycero-D-manno-heptose 1,7-bisphosphate phosphatase
MKTLMKGEGATLDGIYFCPHYPNGKIPPYGRACDCRKPGTGLIQKAGASFDIDMENSYVIGDRCSDIEMAHRANLKGVLVKTGYGKGDLAYVFPGLPYQPFHVAEDLLDAVKWILG